MKKMNGLCFIYKRKHSVCRKTHKEYSITLIQGIEIREISHFLLIKNLSKFTFVLAFDRDCLLVECVR